MINSDGICAIIRASAKANVAFIKIGDVEIEFGHNVRNPARQPTFRARKLEANPSPPEILRTAEDEEKIREIEDLQLLMDSPLQFEDQMIADQLEGAGHQTTNNIGPESDLQ